MIVKLKDIGEVIVDSKLIVYYYFYKKYNKLYNPLAYYLEDNAEQFVKDIESKWMGSEINYDDVIHNEDFADFVLDNYSDLVSYYYEDDCDEMTLDEYNNYRGEDYE